MNVMMTAPQLARCAGTSVSLAQTWVGPVSAAMAEFEIDTPARIAAFLAQAGHESAGLSAIVENLNYSAEGLLVTFPKYFTPAQATAYARQPERIANRVYANRMGNGDEQSGDGWKYRGKGLFQITGQENHALAGMALGIDLLEDPDQLLQPEHAARSSAWYWWNNRLNQFADRGDFVGLTKAINGGTNGLADRQARWGAAKLALGVGS